MTDFVKVPMLPESDASDGGRFVYSIAESAQKSFNDAATSIASQISTREGYANTAREDFKGYYSDLFAQNAQTARIDADNIARNLRDVARFIGQMITAAHAEDQRRRENNAWVERHNNRNLAEQFGDFFFGEEERPNKEPGKAPTFQPIAQTLVGRLAPTPSTGYAQGTSSARPSNLRTYASNSRALDEQLKGTAASLQNSLDSFKQYCYWGTINADDVVRSISEYLTANENDAKWADTIAAAFEAAGGSGAVSTLSDAALASALNAAGVNATRTALEIDPPTAAGAMPTTGYANDPVNTSTGNFIEPESDLGFLDSAKSLEFTRMYNSLASGLDSPGVFGVGWSSVLDQHLKLTDEGARWVMSDGRAVDFPRVGSGWSRASGENYWLAQEPASAPEFTALMTALGRSSEKAPGTVLVVRNNQGQWWAHTPAGLWLGTGYGWGNTVTAFRNNAQEIVQLIHERGRFIDIDYIVGRVAVLAASDGRRVEYSYDSNARLTHVATELGTREYRWNDEGWISSVISAAGVVEAENTYDETGRVTLQVSQHGRRTRFAYLPGCVTAVSNEDGSDNNTWIADTKGRLVGVLDTDNQRQSMAYDEHGNLVSFTERDGSITVHSYNDRGLKARTLTAEGADLSFEYDERDRLTMLVTASGAVIQYEYADEVSRDPSIIRDALGGTTELTWIDGLLTEVIDPVGVRLTFSYDNFGDLIATTNARGESARIKRDHAGRAVAAITPGGHTTVLRYDGAGQLAEQVDAEGASWTFEYDNSGRVVATIDPLGGRVEMSYSSNGELTRTTDALGRVVERSFDEFGNVEKTTLPDGAEWTFEHDGLSRLTSIIDPTGSRWQREYDSIGELSALIDPTGVRTELSTDRKDGLATIKDAFATTTMKFDQYGRPVQIKSEDGESDFVTYDAAGNPVELLDAEGGLTKIERDLAGKVIAITSPTGAQTRFEYDDCGRPVKSIDPLGATTVLSYNQDQLVSSKTLPNGDVESFRYDKTGRLIEHRAPGSGTSRFGYDQAGRLTYSQDPWTGTRRFKYNLAGELIQTTNGVGGVTRFEYDSRGRLVQTTDPAGGVIRREYTDTDQVRSVSDPLGRVTTSEYDPAGRLVKQVAPDGRVHTWTYDRAGREESAAVDGSLLYSLRRESLDRSLVVTDYTHPDGAVMEHVLVFNRRGQLVSRSRGGQSVSWDYDADGRPVGVKDALGVALEYERDSAGRVSAVSGGGRESARFLRDGCGRVFRAVTGSVRQQWQYRDGFPVEHSTMVEGEADSARLSVIDRDEQGRVASVSVAGSRTEYQYDGAGQLIEARSGDRVFTWEYDGAGRLMRETSPEGVRTYAYDAASQLVSVTNGEGVLRFGYDELGRRTRRISPDGSWVEYLWGVTGKLSGTVSKSPEGTVTGRDQVWVDALGEMASLNGQDVWWDTAAHVPAVLCFGSTTVAHLPGGITGVGDQWVSPDWRQVRPGSADDPWSLIGQPTTGLSATGGVEIMGMEWLNFRVYDPATRSFLSTDPLPPVLGAGWDGNPYSYAGNNPLAASDPLGLRPLTDEELKAYDQSSRGAFAAVGNFMADNWEYFVGGAMVIGGGILMATGVGGPAGMMLISAGADTIIQKATTGQVNWGQVALSGALGAVGGVGMSLAKGASQGGIAALRTTMLVNGGIGAGGGMGSYAIRNRSNFSWQGFFAAGAGGFVGGAAGGAAGPAGGTIASQFGRSSTGLLSQVATGGLNFAGGASGSLVNNLIAGNGISWQSALLSGGVSAAGPHIIRTPPGTGMNTLNQMSYFGPRTFSGAFNFSGPNTQAMWTSGLTGTGIGFASDLGLAPVVEGAN